MRPMTDKNGLEVRIDTVSGYDVYAGMLEGTPWLARKMRLRQGQSSMSTPGHYVDGIDLLERELEYLPRTYEIWAPNERWTASVVTPTVAAAPIDKGTHTEWPGHRHVLVVHWYQEGGDPLSRLAEIIARIDFMQYSIGETTSFE